MNVFDSAELYAGGPGSGCNPAAGKCGRSKSEAAEHATTQVEHTAAAKFHQQKAAALTNQGKTAAASAHATAALKHSAAADGSGTSTDAQTSSVIANDKEAIGRGYSSKPKHGGK